MLPPMINTAGDQFSERPAVATGSLLADWNAEGKSKRPIIGALIHWRSLYLK